MLLLPLGLYMVSSLVSSMSSLGVWPGLPSMKALMDITKYAMSLGLREGITPIGIITLGFDSNMKRTLFLSAHRCSWGLSIPTRDEALKYTNKDCDSTFHIEVPKVPHIMRSHRHIAESQEAHGPFRYAAQHFTT